MRSCDRRLLVTGATGLIGRELAEPLLARGFEVHAITVDEVNPDNGFRWLKGSLFDAAFVDDAVRHVRPTHLLNLAWITTGDYLTSPLNTRFLEAGLALAHAFAREGGHRAVYAGSCLEYRLGGDRPIRETDALDVEKTAYTRAKDALRRGADAIFSAAGVSFAFGRIFYAFGRGEARTRLTGLVIDRLSHGERLAIKAGPLLKDYVYSKDIAGAFAALLDADASGCVNICTGRAVSICGYVTAIARKLGREDLLDFVDDCADQPPVVLGDDRRLRDEVGYRVRYGLDAAIDEVLAAERGGLPG